MAKHAGTAGQADDRPSYVTYDSHGGVSVDLAKWLQTPAGRQQLNTLKDLNPSDKTSPSKPKK